jgi:hypothetical protein
LPISFNFSFFHTALRAAIGRARKQHNQPQQPVKRAILTIPQAIYSHIAGSSIRTSDIRLPTRYNAR